MTEDPLELEFDGELSSFDPLELLRSTSLLVYHSYEPTEFTESVVKKSYTALTLPKSTHEWFSTSSLLAAPIATFVDEHELSPAMDPFDPTGT